MKNLFCIKSKHCFRVSIALYMALYKYDGDDDDDENDD